MMTIKSRRRLKKFIAGILTAIIILCGALWIVCFMAFLGMAAVYQDTGDVSDKPPLIIATIAIFPVVALAVIFVSMLLYYGIWKPMYESISKSILAKFPEENREHDL